MISKLCRHASLMTTLMLTSSCLPTGETGNASAEAETSDEPAIIDPASATTELNLNDVSILFPPPSSRDDPILAITDLSFDGSSVWADDAFRQFLAIANSPAGAVAGTDVANNAIGAAIDISAFADKAVWHLASIRIDPGAPGLSTEIADVFGQSAQIRLVLQPVTGDRVHDVAAHMIYSFNAGFEPVAGCPLPRIEPDLEQFRQVIDDFAAIKSGLARGEIGGSNVETDGPLGIHPATDPEKADIATRTAFRDAVKSVLEKHLNPSKLRAMAIMGLPGLDIPEPWIFTAMAMDPRSQQFVPLPSPTLAQDSLRFAQMLDARPAVPGNPSVSPAIKANNLNPITCAFEVPVDPNNPNGPKPPESARGVSTAELFPGADPARMREIVDVIADPTKSHFFNTDCVSCHTETRREMDILDTDRIDAPVDADVLPTELWNVRNFGWFTSFLQGGDDVFATVTRRTATETEEVVEAINAMLLSQ